MKRYAAGIAIGVALTVTVGVFSCEPPEALEYTRVVVKEIEVHDTTVQFIERIVYREVEPELIAVELEGAEDVVEDFCHPDTVVKIVQGDTVRVPSPSYALWNAVKTKPGWFWQRDLVSLYGPNSNGDLVETRFRAYPGWQVATGSRTLIQESRWGAVRPVLEFIVPLAIGWGAHEVFR